MVKVRNLKEGIVGCLMELRCIKLAKDGHKFDGNGRINYQKSETREIGDHPRDGLRPILSERRNLVKFDLIANLFKPSSKNIQKFLAQNFTE